MKRNEIEVGKLYVLRTGRGGFHGSSMKPVIRIVPEVGWVTVETTPKSIVREIEFEDRNLVPRKNILLALAVQDEWGEWHPRVGLALNVYEATENRLKAIEDRHKQKRLSRQRNHDAEVRGREFIAEMRRLGVIAVDRTDGLDEDDDEAMDRIVVNGWNEYGNVDTTFEGFRKAIRQAVDHAVSAELTTARDSG